MSWTMDTGSGQAVLPDGTRIGAATARGLVLVTPSPVTIGAVTEFELLLGARPLDVTARVLSSVPERVGGFTVEVEFLVMSQADRDALADFLQAVGPTALHVRRRTADSR
jgi:hypothetical protein